MDIALPAVEEHGDRTSTTAGGALSCQLLTIAEAAVALNVPTTWLRDKVTARRVPHTRLGRHVRFTAEHLLQIISDGEQPAFQAEPVTARRGRRRQLS